MGLRDFTLFDVIVRNARLFADRRAFAFEGREVTHREYLQQVEKLAGGLADIGVGAGERIAILSQDNLEYVSLYGAAARLGAIVVPINWRLSIDEIAYVIRDTAPRVLIVGAKYQATIAASRDKLPPIEHWYGVGGESSLFAPLGDLLAGSGSPPAADITSDSGFVIVHTAAVGGRPRGALLSHGGLLAANLQLLHCWRLGEDDVNLGAAPLFHVAGLGLLLAVQHAGGVTVVLPRFDPDAALRHIQDYRVTVFAEFAPMLSTLLDRAAEQSSDLSSLRAITGIDAPQTIARFEATCPGAKFWVGYGQSELSGLASLAPNRERPGSVGRPSFLTSICVVDEFDQPVSPGETGEIVARGPMVFKGYWTCEDDNAFTFRNGWHHTGDMGRFDEDGYLWYIGRSPAKELIKPGGENVYPAEVEKAILEHPAIAAVVVLGVPDAQWGEAVKAVCVCKTGLTVTAAELIDFVATRIARYKKPKHVVFVDRLPETSAGTIDRAKLKQTYGLA
jgi:acyl-CoA synthetase (AMP-forming)/AMP-acid ligase II